MTLSIYMANLFDSEDSNKLIESISLDQVKSLPPTLPGTSTCTLFSSGTKSFGFCFDTVEVLKQIVDAFEYFHKCRKNGYGFDGDIDILKLLIQACDVSKIDFSEKGPLGKKGPTYKKLLEDYKNKNTSIKVDEKFKYDPKKLNPFYSTLKAPGT